MGNDQGKLGSVVMEVETIRFIAGIIVLASMLMIKINERKSKS